MTNKCGYPDCKETVLVSTFGCMAHWSLLPEEMKNVFRMSDPGFSERTKIVEEIVAFWTKHWENIIITNMTSTHVPSLYSEAMNIAPNTITTEEDPISEAIEDLESSLCRAARDLERLKRLVRD